MDVSTTKDDAAASPPEDEPTATAAKGDESTPAERKPLAKKTKAILFTAVSVVVGLVALIANIKTILPSDPAPPSPTTITVTPLPQPPSVSLPPSATAAIEAPVPPPSQPATTTVTVPPAEKDLQIAEEPRITFPSNESTVTRCVSVGGRGVPPADHDLLMAVQNQVGSGVYVQRVVHMTNGIWDPTRTVVGTEGNNQSKYALLALSVPKKLTAQFQSDLMSDNIRPYSEDELASLGIEILDRVSVTRAPSGPC